MTVSNPFSITYGGLTVGGSSSSVLLTAPYVVEKSYGGFRLTFEILCIATSSSGLQSICESVEDGFRLRDQNLTIAMGGASWSYTQGTDLLNVVCSLKKSGDREKDRGVSRAYVVTIDAEIPADDRNGLRDFSVGVSWTPSRQQVVTFDGTYTGTSGSTAVANYASECDGEADTILAAIDGGATWELVDESYSRDRNTHTLTFHRQYVQLLADQTAAALDDPAIRDHRISFSDLSQHPGDSREGIYRMRRVTGTYECAVDVEVGTDLKDTFESLVRDHVKALFESTFSPRVFAVESLAVSYNETSKRISASFGFLYQKSEGGDNIAEIVQSVAYRESRQIDYTPVHMQDEFSANADPGWAVRERIWTRTVVVIGEESPRSRIGTKTSQGQGGGQAGEFGERIGGIIGVDDRLDEKVQEDGWNIVANTSEVSHSWIGDASFGQQVQLTRLSETVVERYHKKPAASSGTATRRTGPTPPNGSTTRPRA